MLALRAHRALGRLNAGQRFRTHLISRLLPAARFHVSAPFLTDPIPDDKIPEQQQQLSPHADNAPQPAVTPQPDALSSEASNLDPSEQPNAPPPPVVPRYIPIRGRAPRASSSYPRSPSRRPRGRSTTLENMVTLGGEAKILVLGEVPQRKIKEPIEATEVVVPSPHHGEGKEAPDLIALMEDQYKLSPVESLRAIERMRPREVVVEAVEEDAIEEHAVEKHAVEGVADEGAAEGTAEPLRLSAHDWLQLNRRLLNGFTARQLADYYTTYTPGRKLSDATMRKQLAGAVRSSATDERHPVARSRWEPITNDTRDTPMDVRLAGLGAISYSRTSLKLVTKEAIVDGILRNVWRVELFEEVEGIGQLELLLRPWQLDMLLHSGRDQALLSSIALKRNVTIQVHRKDNAVRITADKSTAELSANDIEQTLLSLQSDTLNLRGWKPFLSPQAVPTLTKLAACLEQSDLDHIAQLTRTCITKTKDGEKLEIRGFSHAATTEAQQYIVSILPFRTDSKHTVDTQALTSKASSSFLMPHSYEKTTLEYPFRGMDLGRWSLPIPRANKSPTQPDILESEPAAGISGVAKHIRDSQIEQVTLKLRPGVQHSLEVGQNVENWSRSWKRSVSVEFGQALFPRSHPDPSGIPEIMKSQTRPLPFQPTLPGLTSFLANSGVDLQSRTDSPVLSYRLVPAPKQKAVMKNDQWDLPDLHIAVKTFPNGKRILSKLALQYPQRDIVHDVLLPGKATDLRFRRSESLEFDPRKHTNEALTAWSDAVFANISSGDRLTAPQLTLDIPIWALPKKPHDPPTTKHTHAITFAFVAVQAIQSAIGTHNNTAISYMTRQSNSLGATNTALRAYPAFTLGDKVENSDITTYVATCFDLADRITDASMSHQPIVKSAAAEHKKPRYAQGKRKIRRALEAGGNAEVDDDEQGVALGLDGEGDAVESAESAGEVEVEAEVEATEPEPITVSETEEQIAESTDASTSASSSPITTPEGDDATGKP